MKSDFPTHQKKLNRKIKISAGIYIISECKSSSEWFIFLFSLVFIFKRFQKLCAHIAGRGPHMFRTFFYPMKKKCRLKSLSCAFKEILTRKLIPVFYWFICTYLQSWKNQSRKTTPKIINFYRQNFVIENSFFPD